MNNVIGHLFKKHCIWNGKESTWRMKIMSVRMSTVNVVIYPGS